MEMHIIKYNRDENPSVSNDLLLYLSILSLYLLLSLNVCIVLVTILKLLPGFIVVLKKVVSFCRK